MIDRSSCRTGLLLALFHKLRNERDDIRLRIQLLAAVRLLRHAEFFQLRNAVFLLRLPRGIPRIVPGQTLVHLPVKFLIPRLEEHRLLQLLSGQRLFHLTAHRLFYERFHGNPFLSDPAPLPVPPGQNPGQAVVRAGKLQEQKLFVSAGPLFLQKLLLHHSGQNQLLSGSCHGHIQNPKLLSQIVQKILPADQPLEKRGPAHALFQIHIIQSDSVPAVKDGFIPAFLPVKALAQPGREDDGKFQPLALVRAHNPHRFPALPGDIRLSEVHTVFLQPLDIADKMEQSVITDFLIILRFLQKHLYIGKPLPAGRHGPNLVQISALGQNLPQKLVNRRACRQFPIAFHLSVEALEPFPKPLLRPVLQITPARLRKALFRICRLDRGHFLRRKAPQHPVHGGGQRNVLRRVVKRPQIRKDGFHLQRLKIAFSGLGAGRDSFLLQYPHKSLAPAGHRPQKDYHIPGARRAQFPVLRHLLCLKHPPDPRGDQMGFRLRSGPAALRLQILPLLLGQKQKLRLASVLLRIDRARLQSRRLVVVDAAQFPAHNSCEHFIDRSQHRLPAAEILVQVDAHPFLSRFVPAVFFQKKPRLRLPEPVDALLHIAHHKTVLPSLPAGADAV